MKLRAMKALVERGGYHEARCQLSSTNSYVMSRPKYTVDMARCVQEAPNDFYYRFDENNNTVAWASLMTSVRPNACMQCPICWEEIHSGHATRMGSSHSLHAGCLAGWQQPACGTSCPVCRGNLAAEAAPIIVS